MPVTSYPPEYLELYRRCAKETVVIPLPTRKEATVWRGKLHKLRVEMREENHPLTRAANIVEFKIVSSGGPDDPAQLVGSPTGLAFIDALEEAGITVVEPEDADDWDSPPDKPAADPMKKFLED